MALGGDADREQDRDNRGREWFNALADTTTRAIAADRYRRAHVDSRVEVVPFIASASWSWTGRLAEAITTDHHLSRPA